MRTIVIFFTVAVFAEQLVYHHSPTKSGSRVSGWHLFGWMAFVWMDGICLNGWHVVVLLDLVVRVIVLEKG